MLFGNRHEAIHLGRERIVSRGRIPTKVDYTYHGSAYQVVIRLQLPCHPYPTVESFCFFSQVVDDRGRNRTYRRSTMRVEMLVKVNAVVSTVGPKVRGVKNTFETIWPTIPEDTQSLFSRVR